MTWPSRDWWSKAFAEVDLRVRRRVARRKQVREAQRTEGERAAQRAAIAARLRGREVMMMEIHEQGWYRGSGGGAFRRVDREASTWWVVDDRDV
jgi:hypothetical protein